MRRKKKNPRPRDEATYDCPTCGEPIVIPIDITQGDEQTFIEDCPVCCHANVIHLELFEDSPPRAWAESE